MRRTFLIGLLSAAATFGILAATLGPKRYERFKERRAYYQQHGKWGKHHDCQTHNRQDEENKANPADTLGKQ